MNARVFGTSFQVLIAHHGSQTCYLNAYSTMTVSSINSREATASFFDRTRVIFSKEVPDESDVKGRKRFEKILRTLLPLASINLGNKKVPVTVMPRLISASAHNPIQRAL